MWDQWTCDVCFEALDEWWVFEDLLWSDHLSSFDDQSDIVQFENTISSIDYTFTSLDPVSITIDDCIICDKDIITNQCSCNSPHDWYDLTSIFRRENIFMSDVYHQDPESSLDCFLCEYYNTYNCVPLRNWYRFYNKYNVYPLEKISFCNYFYPDSVVPNETLDIVFSMLKNKNILTNER